jgi:citrate lyase subunit beta/citryl-CoA lyase
MAIMRSWLFVPGNDANEVQEGAKTGAVVLVLDLEDLVPPAEKGKARKMTAENLRLPGGSDSEVWVRVNSWETGFTDEDLEAAVWPGLDGIVLTKVAGAADVRRLAWRLEALERARGLQAERVKICLLVETALGIIHAYESCAAHPRVVAAIFGAVDYTRDMQVKLTPEAAEQQYARSYLGVAAKAAGIIGLDAPFLDYQNLEGFASNVAEGRQLGYKGQMLVHPSLVEPTNRLYVPPAEDVEWAKTIVKAFEEEALAKGKAGIVVNGKLVDTPVYSNALDILANWREICEKKPRK